MTKEDPLYQVNPFADRSVSDQLSGWITALEITVATLNKTLVEFKEFQEKGVPDVGSDSDTGSDSPDGNGAEDDR